MKQLNEWKVKCLTLEVVMCSRLAMKRKTTSTEKINIYTFVEVLNVTLFE